MAIRRSTNDEEPMEDGISLSINNSVASNKPLIQLVMDSNDYNTVHD